MHADRRKFIGGSDVSAILGVSQWATPLDVWLEKVGERREVGLEKERILRRGRRLEPLIIDMLIEELGVEVTKRSANIEGQNRYQDPEHDFLSAEIDFEWRVTDVMVARFPQIDPHLIGTIQNGDAKSCHQFVAHKFGEDGTDEIPIEYHAQAQHGLMVTGRELTLFAVLVGTDNLLTYIVLRDEETVAGIREKAIAFWRHHVETGVPPEPIVLEDAVRLLRRKPATTLEADAELARMLGEYRLAKQQVGAAEARADELKYAMACAVLGAKAMDDPSPKPKHVITIGGEPALTIGYQEQTRIDTAALKARHPEIAQECSKTAGFFRFDLPRKRSTR